MSDIRLGETPTVDHRDAIHVAVIPMTAPERLTPGQRVGVTNNEVDPHADAVGIVDPYLTDDVPKGGRFWLCLLPNTVIGMRHHWQHPRFACEQKESPEFSEQWLRRYAVRMNEYDKTEDAAFERLLRGLRTGELFAYGTELHGLYELDDAGELREHAEAFLGITIDWSRFEFTCSC